MSKLWAGKWQLIRVSKLWRKKILSATENCRVDFCTACFLVLLCLKGKSLFIPALCSARTCRVSGAVFAVSSPSCSSQTPAASRSPPQADGLLLPRRISAGIIHGCQGKKQNQPVKNTRLLRSSRGSARLDVNDTECNARRRGGEELLPADRDSGWGTLTVTLSAFIPVSVTPEPAFPMIQHHSTLLAR